MTVTPTNKEHAVKLAKLDHPILTALGLTFKRHPEHANKLLNRPRTVGSRLIGRYAAADAFVFRKLFCRDGLQEVQIQHPLVGCRYFDVPLSPGEGVVGAISLREALSRGISIWVEDHPQYGWRFVSNHIGDLTPATCLRMVLGPASLKEEIAPKELIFWHWFPHNPALLEGVDSETDISNHNDLISHARQNFDKTVVKLAKVSGSAERIWPSIFNGQMSGIPMVSTTDDTTVCPIISDPEQDGSETTVVLEFSPDSETGRIVHLKSITSDDAQDIPKTLWDSEEERSLRLE